MALHSACFVPGVFHHIFFFFNDAATTELYTLSLHDALPIYGRERRAHGRGDDAGAFARVGVASGARAPELARRRSEEHTSELQSHSDLVCRLLLEKKKTSAAPRPLVRSQPQAHQERRSSSHT